VLSGLWVTWSVAWVLVRAAVHSRVCCAVWIVGHVVCGLGLS